VSTRLTSQLSLTCPVVGAVVCGSALIAVSTLAVSLPDDGVAELPE